MIASIRACKPADISTVINLLFRCLTADPIDADIFQRKVLDDPNFDPRGALVAVVKSRIVGFGLGIVRRVQLEDAAPDFDRSWITLLAVDAEFRRQKIATMIVDALEDYFIKRKCTSTWVSPYAPNYFTPGVDVTAYPEALEFFKSLGYEEAYRPLSMETDLDCLITPDWVKKKEADLTDKVTIECYRPELVQPLMDWMRNEFPGDWQRVARELITKIKLGEFRSDNLWIAHENEIVVGYCQHDNNGRFGPFGVSAVKRGRGIGAFLLLRCLQTMQAKGMHKAWFLWTDDNAAKLYAQVGFVEKRRFVVLRKALR